jgi:hypothetical protein
VIAHDEVQRGLDRVHRCIRAHLGGIEDQHLAPDETRCNALRNDRLAEAAEDRQPEPRTNLAQ